jgi:hypothetical protein
MLPVPNRGVYKIGRTTTRRSGYKQDSVSTLIRNLDIFRQLPNGAPLWRGTSPNLEEAKKRANELASAIPFAYGVFDVRSAIFVLPFTSFTATQRNQNSDVDFASRMLLTFFY